MSSCMPIPDSSSSNAHHDLKIDREDGLSKWAYTAYAVQAIVGLLIAALNGYQVFGPVGGAGFYGSIAAGGFLFLTATIFSCAIHKKNAIAHEKDKPDISNPQRKQDINLQGSTLEKLGDPIDFSFYKTFRESKPFQVEEFGRFCQTISQRSVNLDHPMKEFKVKVTDRKAGTTEVVIAAVFGEGSSKRAFEFQEDQVLMLPNTDMRHSIANWEEVVKLELQAIGTLRACGLLAPLNPEPVWVSIEGSANLLAYTAKSFRALAEEGIYVIDTKNTKSTTWTGIFEECANIAFPNTRTWDSILDKFLTDLAILVYLGFDLSEDRRNMAVINSEDDVYPHLRYLGFDLHPETPQIYKDQQGRWRTNNPPDIAADNENALATLAGGMAEMMFPTYDFLKLDEAGGVIKSLGYDRVLRERIQHLYNHGFDPQTVHSDLSFTEQSL